MNLLTKRLFGRPPWTSWEVASNQIAAEFLGLRSEFYERCLEALDWNVSKGTIRVPSTRERPSRGGYAELGVMAFQLWTARLVSFGRGYLDASYKEAFFPDLGPRVCGNDDEITPELITSEVLRFDELHPDAELQNIHLASRVAAHFYPENATEDDRRLAIMVFAKVVPPFSLRLHAAVASAFGDMKTTKQLQSSIRKVRAAGEGY